MRIVGIIYLSDQSLGRAESQESVIILSPRLYWYEPLKLPTRSMAKAKKLAQHAMSTRPSDYTKLLLIRQSDHYACYAYNPDEIDALMAAFEVEPSPWCFAQQLADQLPVEIRKDELYLDGFQGIGIESADSEESARQLGELTFAGVKLFAHEDASKQGADRKLLWTVAALLIAAAGWDLGLRWQKIRAIDDTAAREGGVQKSGYEMQALVKQYGDVKSDQVRLRESIAKSVSATGLTKLDCLVKKGCKSE